MQFAQLHIAAGILLVLAALPLTGGCRPRAAEPEPGPIAQIPERPENPPASGSTSEKSLPERGVVREAEAEGTEGEPRRWAVIVGINQYLDPAIPNLRCCVADCRRLAETLTTKCGYSEDRILVLSDAQQDHLLPLRFNLREQIGGWLRHAQPGDSVLVFFSGHGFLDAEGRGYLAPKDCRLNNLTESSYPTEELRDALRECRATRKMLILDCCHAGSDRDVAESSSSGQELGAAFTSAAGLITLASCAKAEKSHEWDAHGHGLFTWFLTEGLQGKADFDRDGIVDSDELYRYTVDKVPVTAQRMLNARQTPVRIIGADVVGVFPLAVLASAGETVRPLPEPSPGPVTDPLGGDHAPAVVLPEPPTREPAAPAWSQTHQLLGHQHIVQSVAFNSAGTSVLSSSLDGSLKLWDTRTGECLKTFKPAEPERNEQVLGGAIAPGDARILSVHYTFARLWDAAAGKPMKFIKDPQTMYYSAAISPDGAFGVLANHSTVQLCDLETGEITKTLTGLSSSLSGLSFNGDGSRLAAVDYSHVIVWDIASGEERRKIEPRNNPAGIAFRPDGSQIAVSGHGGALVFDAATGRPVTELKGHYNKVPAVAFNAAGTRLATGGDAMVVIRDTTTWEKLHTVELAGAVTSLAFSPDDRQLAIGGAGFGSNGEVLLIATDSAE